MTKSNEYSYSREQLSRFWIAICLLAMAPRQCRKFHCFSKCRAIFKLMELCKKKKKKNTDNLNIIARETSCTIGIALPDIQN